MAPAYHNQDDEAETHKPHVVAPLRHWRVVEVHAGWLTVDLAGSWHHL